MCLACSLVRLALMEGVQAYYASDYKASYNSLKVMGAPYAGFLDWNPAAALLTDRQPCLPCRMPSRSGSTCRSLTTAWLLLLGMGCTNAKVRQVGAVQAYC